MLIPRKITVYIVTAIISIMLIIGTNPIYAENIYPLEYGEKLIQETEIDENHTEIFTQLNEAYYLKKLQRNESQWVLESSESLSPKWTGLKVNKINERVDRNLAKAIESKLGSHGLEAASLPQIVDYSHSEFLPPVGEQYENSCVGWATGYYLRTYQEAREIGWEVKSSGNRIDSHVFSPSFIYNQIRQEDEYGNPDGGAYIDHAGNLLMNMGAATMAGFPYVQYDIYTQPSPAVKQSAEPHKIQHWELLYSDEYPDSYIIEMTRQYLNTGDLVVAAGRVGLNFMYNLYRAPDGTRISILEPDTDYGHAYVIVGYDDTLVTPDGVGAFKLINSYGPGWGNDGFCYISYQAFAANAIGGYIFTDLLTAYEQELAIDINDTMIFNMSFSGTGRFDFKIEDANEKLIYEENNLQGQQGLNTLTWNGKDMTENSVEDGAYKLSIIPYRGDTPKPAFNTDFNKLGKVASASADAYSFENIIQYVLLPITFKSDSIMSIKVDYNGQVQELISNQSVKAGESKTYKIFKKDFNFNNKDLSKVKIIIDIL